MLKSYIEFLNESLSISNGIKQKDVPKTQKILIENILNLLRLTENDVAFIGSAGKKKLAEDLSNNINVAVDLNNVLKENNLELEDLEKFIQLQFKRINIKVVKENNKFIFKFPINGNFKKQNNVDIHLELVENLEWIKFSRYSPNLRKNESEYTSKYREAVFHALVESLDRKIISYFDTNEKVKEYQKYYYSHSEGVGVVSKTFEGKNGVLKKSIILESSKRIVTSNPQEFVEMVFGKNIKIEDVSTFEKCLNIINSKNFEFKKKIETIKENIKSKLIEFNLEIPENL
jgi:hypothetical protein